MENLNYSCQKPNIIGGRLLQLLGIYKMHTSHSQTDLNLPSLYERQHYTRSSMTTAISMIKIWDNLLKQLLISGNRIQGFKNEVHHPLILLNDMHVLCLIKQTQLLYLRLTLTGPSTTKYYQRKCKNCLTASSIQGLYRYRIAGRAASQWWLGMGGRGMV